jgi:hypothetical protein
MRIPLTLRLTLTIVLCAASISANAQTTPDVRGFWAGFNQGVEPSDRGTVDLKITIQSGSQFKGSIRGITQPEDIPLNGTIDASGNISMVGKVRENTTIQVIGKVREVAGRWIAARYEIKGPGVNIRGVLITLRSVGGGSPDPGADITGAWRGELRSLGGGTPDPSSIPAWAYLQNVTGTTALTGRMALSGSTLTQDGSVRFSLRGRIANFPVFDSPIQLLGVDLRNGIVGILIGLKPAAYAAPIGGQYRLYRSMFDAFNEFNYGGNTAADAGKFSLGRTTLPPPFD